MQERHFRMISEDFWLEQERPVGVLSLPSLLCINNRTASNDQEVPFHTGKPKLCYMTMMIYIAIH